MRASEAVRASTSRSLTLMFPNLTVTIPPKTHIFAGPSLSRTLKHGVGSLSSCYKRLFFGMEVVQVLVALLRLPLCCFVGEESWKEHPQEGKRRVFMELGIFGMGGARDRSPLGRLARPRKGGSQLATSLKNIYIYSLASKMTVDCWGGWTFVSCQQLVFCASIIHTYQRRV